MLNAWGRLLPSPSCWSGLTQTNPQCPKNPFLSPFLMYFLCRIYVTVSKNHLFWGRKSRVPIHCLMHFLQVLCVNGSWESYKPETLSGNMKQTFLMFSFKWSTQYSLDMLVIITYVEYHFHCTVWDNSGLVFVKPLLFYQFMIGQG